MLYFALFSYAASGGYAPPETPPMNLDTEVIRAEPHVEIGGLLQRNAAGIVERWCGVARDAEAAAQRVHHEVLRDEFGAFLQAIGSALKDVGNSSTSAHFRLAREHGDQRWQNGWSLTEVVRDYQLMRLVVLEFLEENLGRPLYYREGMAVGVFIDDAIAASISRYVKHRDEHIHAVERERTETVASLSRRKDEFLAILGHELRNPLAPISNCAAVIRKLVGNAHPAVITSLDVLDRQSRQLVRLVDDILDLARISRGEFELRKETFDLRTAIDQAVQIIEPLVKERGHQVQIAMPATALHLNADPHRMTQIAANLLNNAAKYTEPGGNISLTVENRDEAAVIRVRDNGIGIAPEMLSEVFELFARVEQQEASGRDGLGIGLALVQRLVQQHGGTITAASGGLGQGAEFVVTLPKRAASDQVLVITPVAVDTA